MVLIVQDVCLPGIVPATSCTDPCTRRDLLLNPKAGTRRMASASRRLDHRGGTLRASRQQAVARGIAQLPAVPRTRTGVAHQRSGGGRVGQNRLRHVPFRIEKPRSDRAPCRFPVRARCAVQERFPALLGSYHPSQQNTSTGKLTQEMLDDVFANAARLIRSGPAPAAPRR